MITSPELISSDGADQRSAGSQPGSPRIVEGPLLPPLGERPRRGPVRALVGKAVSAQAAAAARNVDSSGVAPRANWRFMLRHPAHLVALGFGSGLSPLAPGTAATLWAWVAFLVAYPVVSDSAWALVIAVTTMIGWWASKVTAGHLSEADPGRIVIDEIVAFWLVLWLVMPTGLWGQLAAFVLFRWLDAAKPGPVGWADRAYKDSAAGSWRGGWGIMADDFVAAGCTVLLIAIWRAV